MKRTLRHLQAKFGWRHPRPLLHFLVVGTQGRYDNPPSSSLTASRYLFAGSKGSSLLQSALPSNRQWYADHYKSAKPGQVRGDITPFYLFHAAVPERIHSVLPKARLIALLRDPVDRLLSQYFHARRHGYEKLDLMSALAAEEVRLSGADAVSGHMTDFTIAIKNILISTEVATSFSSNAIGSGFLNANSWYCVVKIFLHTAKLVGTAC